MAYMSYCRFEGTLHELRACMGAVGEHVNEEAQSEISESEIRCFRKMVNEFCSFLQDMNLLDEDGVLDEDQLDEVCEAMGKSYEEEWE